MKFIFGIALALPIWAGAQCSSSSLFFSEYIEGTGNNKAIEIFNGTANEIDLADYKIEIYFNGNTSPAHTKYLIGKLSSGKVHVTALNSSSDTALIGKANQTDTYPFSWFNGNDALVLKDITTNTIMDVIGEVGIDPGEAWGAGKGETKDQTMIRKSHIIAGNINWQSAKDEWIAFPLDYFDDLGTHTSDCALPLRFIDLSGKAVNEIVELAWVFDSRDTGKFFIQHSNDGSIYNIIGSVQQDAKGSSPIYKYVHLTPNNGVNYYQIVFHSLDGSSVSSYISSVVKKPEIKVKYNQVDSYLDIEFSNHEGGEVYIFDVNGRQLLHVEISGQYHHQIPLLTISSSPVYCVKVINGDVVKSFTLVK